MQRSLQLTAMAAVLLLSVARPCTAQAELAADQLRQLPRETLAVVVVHNLGELSDWLSQTGQQTGVPLPSLRAVLAPFAGVDVDGGAMFALVAPTDGPAVPLLMLQVDDFAALVEPLGGIPGESSTTISLAGQTLHATHRDGWAILTSDPDHLGDGPLALAEDLAATYAAGIPGHPARLSLVVPREGLERLVALQHESPLNPDELARLRRMFRTRRVDWTSSDYWRDAAQVYAPLVESFTRHTSGIVFHAGGDPKQGLEFVATLLPSPHTPAAASDESPPVPLPALRVGERKAFLTLHGPLQAPLRKVATWLFLANVESRGDDLGVAQFPPAELDRYRQGVHAVAEQIRSVCAIADLPLEKEPVLANQAFLLGVDDSQQFLERVDELNIDWNRLVEGAQREVELVFDPEPLEIAGHRGTRYAVDLTEAFGLQALPEVRDVMIALYGNTGQMRFDLLAVTPRQVLLSQLPDDQTALVLRHVKSTEPDATPEHLTFQLDPAVLQEWLNANFRASSSTPIVGWEPRTFPSTEKLTLQFQTTPQGLRLTLDIPGDILSALGERLRPAK